MSRTWRTRQRGLSTEPFMSTTVRLLYTLDPDSVPVDMSKSSENQHNWTVASADASHITDIYSDEGPNVSGDFTMAQSVVHYKVLQSSLKSKIVHLDIPNYVGTCLFDVRGSFPYGRGGFADEFVCPRPPTEVISRFALTCIEEMESQFPPEQDFLSFILELKDLTSTMDTLFDIAQAIRNLSPVGRKRNGKRRRRPKPPSIRDAARIHAGYNFGVSPILSDVATLSSTFKRVRDRIEWIMRNAGKWVRVGARSSYRIEEDTAWGDGFGYAGWSPGCHIRRKRQIGTLHATARVMQEVPNVAPWLFFTQGVIKDMGFDKPLTTLWEVMPFSWLVDYFVPISGWLKTVQHRLDPYWHVRDPSWSYKTTYEFDLPITNCIEENQNLGSFSLQSYSRMVGLPEWEWYTTTPSWKQLSLLAAVAQPEGIEFPPRDIDGPPTD